MVKKKSKKKWIILFISIFLLLIIGFFVNWFLTYRLENILREKLRVIVRNSTDNFYDFTFSDLKVGLWNGELKIKNLTLYPDSTTIDSIKEQKIQLPKNYFSINIEEVDFQGINLTWLFNYKKLHFKRFALNAPTIKITSGKHQKEVSKLELESDTTMFVLPNLYQFIEPYFDYIKVDDIDFKDATVEYTYLDSIPVQYKLYGFSFNAHKFSLDPESYSDNKLLYSDYFNFQSNIPQTIFESDQFAFLIDKIDVSTQDSLIVMDGVHMRTRNRYWNRKINELGDRIDAKVGQLKISSIDLRWSDVGNTLFANKFEVSRPRIDYLSVVEDTLNTPKKDNISGSLNWSLYDIISPIFLGVYIDTIRLDEADLKYEEYWRDKKLLDTYTLNNLNVLGRNFILDTASIDLSRFNYLNDLSLSTDSLRAYIASKNSDLVVGDFHFSSQEKLFNVKNIDIRPISTAENKNYILGHVDEIDISELNYKQGVQANSIQINHPQVTFILNKINKTKKSNEEEEEEENENRDLEDAFLAVAPFISYIRVGNIAIEKGVLELQDKIKKINYKISDLYFASKNLRLENSVDSFRINWDEYIVGFRNFDNVTPDLKYRIQIQQGHFDSTLGNVYLTGLDIQPTNRNNGAYIRIKSPLVKLENINLDQLINKKIMFNTFTLESPKIDVVNQDRISNKAKNTNDKSEILNILPFDLLSFNNLYIPFSDISMRNEQASQAIRLKTDLIQVDDLKWEVGKLFDVENLIIDKPLISILDKKAKKNLNKERKNITFQFEDININNLRSNDVKIKLNTKTQVFDIDIEEYRLKNLKLNTMSRSTLNLDTMLVKNPNILLKINKLGDTHENINIVDKSLNFSNLVSQFPSVTNEAYINILDINNLNLNYENIDDDGNLTKQNLKNTNFILDNIKYNRNRKLLFINDVVFSTKDYQIALADSFYTLKIQDLYFSKAKKIFTMDSISLISNIPKFTFAYDEKNHKDWFNINIGAVSLLGLDIDKYIKQDIIYSDKLSVHDVLLQNFKNQKIETAHHLSPLLYQIFQKLPVDYYIDSVDVSNFSVIYEELGKNDFRPGLISFTEMNGQIQGFTNLPDSFRLFYDLHANGKAFGVGEFEAVWSMPISPNTNLFYLNAWMNKPMPLQALNPLITPMAPIKIRNGEVEELFFESSSTDSIANVNLKFLYRDVYVDILKNKRSTEINTFATKIVNSLVLRHNNPNDKNQFITAQDSIIRDPYHSNFNYIWQMLRPPLIQSVGVSKGKQRFAGRIGAFVHKMRHLFDATKPKDESEESE